jgi:hypothetical protein
LAFGINLCFVGFKNTPSTNDFQISGVLEIEDNSGRLKSGILQIINCKKEKGER